MTLLDAIRSSITGGTGHHRPIRRASWAAGTHIQWSAHRRAWLFATGRGGPTIALVDGHPQGCLTPTGMLAMDWEVVEP